VWKAIPRGANVLDLPKKYLFSEGLASFFLCCNNMFFFNSTKSEFICVYLVKKSLNTQFHSNIFFHYFPLFSCTFPKKGIRKGVHFQKEVAL